MDTAPPDTAALAPDGFLPLPETVRVLAGLDWRPAHAEMEYNHPILPGDRLRLAYRLAPGRAGIWLLNEAMRLASAQLTWGPGDPGTSGSPAQGNHG